MHSRALDLITALDLNPHPEGGFFREVHRSTSSVKPRDGRPERAALTTIYFLLVAGQVSRWHRVASDEAWHFLEGEPLELLEADAEFDRVITKVLAPYQNETEPIHVVAGGKWQAARTTGEYTLVGCTVGPGFDYSDFELLRDLGQGVEGVRRKDARVASFL